MENPKIRRIRRHASLHPRLHLATSSSRILSNSKSNPHVPYFRHSPPTAKCSVLEGFNRLTKPLPMKKSAYVGFFRHSPPTRFLVLHRRQIQRIEEELKKLIEIEARRQKLIKVDGYLRGGSPYGWSGTRESLKRTLNESSEGSPSATIQVLSRLAHWFLFPLAHDESSCGYRHDCSEKQVIDLFPHVFDPYKTSSPVVSSDDECSSVSNQDDESDDSSLYSAGTYIAMDRGRQSSAYDPTGKYGDVSISSLAAAYYAHQAAEGMDRSFHSNDLLIEDEDRLDYMISQMDIARMARNASRHLDVESILSLPTTTYHEGKKCGTPPPEPDHGEETGASWMIVPPMEEELAGPQDRADGHVCVICLEKFAEGDRLRVLPCSHSFHVGCIDRWLSGSHSFDECFTSGCPTCKKQPTSPTNDGSVPSWAFARLGSMLANSTTSL